MGGSSLTATAIKLRFVSLVVFGWRALTNVTGSLNGQICLIIVIIFNSFCKTFFLWLIWVHGFTVSPISKLPNFCCISQYFLKMNLYFNAITICFKSTIFTLCHIILNYFNFFNLYTNYVHKFQFLHFPFVFQDITINRILQKRVKHLNSWRVTLSFGLLFYMVGLLFYMVDCFSCSTVIF